MPSKKAPIALTERHRRSGVAEPDARSRYTAGARHSASPRAHAGWRPPAAGVAYSLLFTLPGTPVIRYGDEIGMGDDLSLTERDSARTPMQWSHEPNGGFTKSASPLLPVLPAAHMDSNVNAAI